MTVLNQRNSCPVCCQTQTQTVYSSNFSDYPIRNFLHHYYRRNNLDFNFLNDEKFIIKECKVCGLIYQESILNDEYMQKFYDEWLTLPEETEVKQSYEYYNRLSKEVESIFNLFPKKVKYKVLDFGAGWGEWSMMAKAYGAEVYGLELSTCKTNFLDRNGINVLDREEIKNHTYDFINTEQVFEHISKPSEVFGYLSNQLASDGIIKISVPNGVRVKTNLTNPDWFADRFGDRSLMPISPLEHINCYGVLSINYLAEQHNLK